MEITEEHYRIAEVAYDAYVKQTGGVSLISGERLPPFGVLKQSIKDAWAAAGMSTENSWR